MKNKERTLDSKIEQYDRRERELEDKGKSLEDRTALFAKREAELDRLEDQTRRRAEEISGMTVEEAKKGSA